jgi:hypothetical protein
MTGPRFFTYKEMTENGIRLANIEYWENLE